MGRTPHDHRDVLIPEVPGGDSVQVAGVHRADPGGELASRHSPAPVAKVKGKCHTPYLTW